MFKALILTAILLDLLWHVFDRFNLELVFIEFTSVLSCFLSLLVRHLVVNDAL